MVKMVWRTFFRNIPCPWLFVMFASVTYETYSSFYKWLVVGCSKLFDNSYVQYGIHKDYRKK